MKTLSAAAIKSQRNWAKQQPREGTKLRRAYDWFMLHPVTPVRMMDVCEDNYSGILRQLTDFYGLDIRPYGRLHPRKHWLVGHFDAHGIYHDFVAHRVAA